MDFLRFMRLMFDLNRDFPNMTWDSFPSEFVDSKIVITLPVDYDIAAMLNDAELMFAKQPARPLSSWSSDEPPF